MKILKIIKEEYNLIKEYITNNEIYLKDYLSMSEERKKEYLPHEYYYFFNDFLIETDTDFEMPKETQPSLYKDEPDEEVDMFDDNDIEFIFWLESNNKELYNEFADYLYDKITNNTLDIPDSEYPAWSFFDVSPQLIKNQWLVHFTKDAESIANNGFKYGVDEMDKLGLTTQLGEFEKKYGGYNFAYTLNDFEKYGASSYGNWTKSGYKYGNEVILFRASGIKVWHYGDNESQVIFYGNTATNFIPITEGENEKWGVFNQKNYNLLFENDDLETVVFWVVNNYDQYRKVLH